MSPAAAAATADTFMNRPNAELMAKLYPGVLIRESAADFETLLSIDRARKRLGFEPRHSWRDHVKDS